ncbi:MAG TPA: hypothetical protein VI387_03895, partial [Candidatus Brocadiales bacterium]|nr:hypothetical protein [Candidatus Brocadiales bacterium]
VAAICCGIASLAFGMSLWLIPLIHHVKFTNLLGNALTFTNGHFTDWGGTVGTLPHISLRLLAFLQCLLCNGLGFWWHDTSTINLIPSLIMIMGVLSYRKHLFQNLLANCHCEPKAKQSHYMGLLRSFHSLAMTRTCNWLSNERTKFILLYIIPYSLWALFCQNIEKPRHILPLVPMLLICLSYGLVKISPDNIFKTIIIGLLAVALGVSSFSLVIKHKRTPPLQVQVMNYITDNFDKLSTRLYCWDTKRLFDYYAPVWDTRRARNISGLKYDINSSLVIPDTVLCTSQVEGIARAISGMTLLRRFRTDRYIDNPCSELSLYVINTNPKTELF